MNKNEIDSFIEKEQKKAGKRHLFKSFDPKEFTSGENGTISGYFATFDHDHGDSWGDVIRKGAFLGTIARRKKTGHPFPLCYGHDFNQIIGRVTDIGEDNKGAYFTAEFFPTDRAQEIRAIVKSGALWQFSFAYDTLDAKKIRAGDGSEVNELRELELYEISIVGVPANPRAVITDIKGSRAEQKEELLRDISLIREERKIRAELFYKGTGCHHKFTLTELRRMEEQCLKDIEKWEASGKTERAERRRNALVNIRLEIAKLEEEEKRNRTPRD